MSSFNTSLLFGLFALLTIIDLGNCCDEVMFKIGYVQNMVNEDLKDLYFRVTCEDEDGNDR